MQEINRKKTFILSYHLTPNQVNLIDNTHVKQKKK